MTSEILHAYARALPRLMGAWLRRPVHPLGFGRGSLVAVATSVPVDLPGLRYVQTSSPLVCRELGAAVPLFHVDNKECLLALRERGGAVTRVWVERVLPFEFDAPFEVIFHKPRYRAPVWRARTAPDHLALLADLDDDRTFAWDRDLGGEVVYDYDRDVTHDASAATLDVAPHPNPPPWSPLEAFAIAGAGWAATCLQRPSRDGDRVRATEDRRWLLLHAFPSHDVLDGLAQRWEARRDTRALLAEFVGQAEA